MVRSRHAPFLSFLFCVLMFVAAAAPAMAEQTEKRIALVLGNSAYTEGELPTTANDAGLIAQTLQAAGFDVTGARDLDGDALRRAFRDFLERASQSGPDTVALVYFAGYGLQFEGENYLVPVDARIQRAGDVPIQAVRVSDLMRPMAELPLKARMIILDAARENPFAREGQPLAGGLALVEPDPGMLVAFNAAPGTVAPESRESYGAYAKALAEMMRQGGTPLKDVFDQVRLRVSDLTKGAVVPWDADRIETPFVFFERAPDAPVPPPAAGLTELRDRPIRDLGAQEAYQAALERDTIQAYQDFLAAYGDDPLAKRVRALLAARREALTWRRTLRRDTPEAYWSYLRRYPRGPHAADAHRRLARLAAELEPPPSFEEIEYDIPPPPPEEIVYVDRPVLILDDPVFDLPPPPPVVVLPPPPVYIVELPPPPPPPPDEYYVLPVPVYQPLPTWVNRPAYVAPPPVNVISYNIHNTVVVNPASNTVTVTNPAGQPVAPFANAIAAGVVPRPAAGAGEASPLLAPGGGQQVPAAGGAGGPAVSPGVAAGIGAALGAGATAAALRVAVPPSVAAKGPPAFGRWQRGAVNPGAAPGWAVAPPAGAARPAFQGQQQPQQFRPLPGQVLPGQQQPARPLPGQQGVPGVQQPLPGVQQQVPGAVRPGQLPGTPFLRGQVPPGQQQGRPAPGQVLPVPGQARPGQPGFQPNLQGQPGRVLPGQVPQGQFRPGQIQRPGPGLMPQVQPGGQQPTINPMLRQREIQRQQQMERQQQMQQQRQQQILQQRQQQQMNLERQRQMQMERQQQRQQQFQMQRQQQMQQQRQQQMQIQRQQQMQQQRQQQLQMQQQRQQQFQMQRQQQMQMQRQQQMQQMQIQRQQQMQQQMQMQRQQQMQMQRQQQMQQQMMQRQQQIQRQQQMQRPQFPACGHPGQPPCR